jgi:CRISPR system Cascade subunit CasD
MNVLLLRLAGPMQSWDMQSRFPLRTTGLEPSKSGVIGLICAALGRHRGQPIKDLARLLMGVRVDREGKMGSDYHTALNVIKASGAPSKTGEAVVSRRFYLADADFLVGLEGEDLNFLKEIDAALQNPCWPLFLGRKAFPPGKPVHVPDGLQPGKDLHQALTQYLPRPTSFTLIVEDHEGETIRVDQPVAPFIERRFAPRRVTVKIMREEELCISPC